MNSKAILLRITGGVGFFLIFSIAPGMARPGEKTLPGHVRAAVRRLAPIGLPPRSKRVDLAIGLPLRNQGQLNEFLQQLYDPNSRGYRQYLTPDQFTEMFGPTIEDYQMVIQFAQSSNFTITGTHRNRIVLDVSGTVSDIEKAFHITIRAYQHPTEARSFYAPDVEPSVDSALPILRVSGLDNYSIPHPNLRIKPAYITTGVSVNSGSGPKGSYRGNDFRAAYAPGVSLTGAGQAVGLVEFDGYYPNDIITYEHQASLPNVPLTNVLIGGFNGTPGPSNSEVALDIEMALAMAPGLSRIYVYEAPNAIPWVDVLSRMADDNLAKQLSCSWSGGDPDEAAEEVFQQMAAQGQSFFAASGDSAAWTDFIEFPGDSPNITVVGGTTLSTTGPGGSWVSETVWNVSPTPDIYGFGSSGGVSPNYSIPSWQQGIYMTLNQGSTTYRNVPDVALTADNIYVVDNNGAADSFVGTSCAAPLWAGFTALVNEQAAANGQPPVGFLNPSIYALANGPNYASDFHDVTVGNNTWIFSPTRFYAVSGYDLCTGLGTPNGMNLINDLLSLPPPTPTPTPTPSSQYLVSVRASPSGAGTVTGGGNYEPNSNVIVTATQNDGYNFVNWAEKGSILSTSPTYTFTLNSNRTLVANFVPFVATPNISPNGGTFKKRITVQLFCATAGATIYYTTDGSDPTTASSVYDVSTRRKRRIKGIKISGKGLHTIKAMGVESGYTNSDVATANFTIN